MSSVYELLREIEHLLRHERVDKYKIKVMRDGATDAEEKKVFLYIND